VILDDVARIDRLIGDISSASRLDAELSRGQASPVDVVALLGALVELHDATRKPEAPRVVLDVVGSGSGGTGPFIVSGIEDRLGQVFRNVLSNAESFSPQGSTAGGAIRIAARRDGRMVVVTIDDEGPGIPQDKQEAIFDRFYSERPKGEKFGMHSGLGLSISRQIVQAHGGTITAENRVDAAGTVTGARFTIKLPAV
jgi:two-component system sensor histidine kinase ChvG